MKTDLFVESNKNLVERFKKIYFHLYTNSKVSRAEKLADDLSLIVLIQQLRRIPEVNETVQDFLKGLLTSAELILAIRHRTPDLRHDETFHIADETIREAFEELEDLDLSQAPAHTIGEAFQAIVGPRLRGEKGQFFTPHSLVQAIVEIVKPKPSDSILDPACGTGGFLVEANNFRRKSKAKVTGHLVGAEKDQDLCRLASIMIKLSAEQTAVAININSLDERQWKQAESAGSVPLQFDVILTNPPFGSKIGVTDSHILKAYALGHCWRRDDSTWHQTAAVASTQDPQTLFVELCVRRLRPGGRMGIVLPEGMFGNKQTGYVWQWLRQQGDIIALLDCPRTTFQPGTDTKTNVLFFRKSDAEEKIKSPVKVAVALRCGHDRRGRTHKPDGSRFEDDFAGIARAFDQTPSSEWTEVANPNWEYLVPRYYVKPRTASQHEAELLRGAKFSTLGALVKDGILSVKKGHEVGSESYGTGEIPFVRTSDLANFEITSDPTKSVGDQIYSKYASQQSLTAGDILLVVDGRYRIGTAALITDRNRKCVVQSHLRIISIRKPKKIDHYELLFALSLPSVKLAMRNLVFVQSTLGTLGSRLLELEIPLFSGDGLWRSRIESFRAALSQRDRLLGEIAQLNEFEVEL